MKRILIYCLFLLCWSCKDKDNPEPELPEITSLDVTEITETTAKCTFYISSPEAIQKAGVIYDANYSLPAEAPEVSTTAINNGYITLALNGLENNTYYFYKAYITTIDDENIYSTVRSFKTEPPPLEVSTSKVEVEYREAACQFEVFAKLAWTITSSQPWCTVEPESGDGSSAITVYVTENLTGAPRYATINVTADNISRQVTIEQSLLTLSDIEPEMVFVPGGAFTMGCTSERGNDCYDDALPAHQVAVSDFYISKTEITQDIWKVVTGNNPSYFKGDSLPVENVSWNEVQEFINRLNTLTGKKYRLPTEAEWEFAARGGNNSKDYKYSGSNDVDSVAWYWNNIPNQSSTDEGYGTQPVGQKAPNELNIYDMSGNVFEWCNDWYGEYDGNAQTDPTGPLSGSYRVVRGGSWNSNEMGVSVSYRGFILPDVRHYYLGFRLVCN